ncbi:hypothetical protein MMPV_001713 [Pyropia vietnamensis]
MNSKFFATGDSSPDSDDRSVTSSDEDQVAAAAAPVRASRFARDSDSDDEDVKRVVKSSKDKRLDAMITTVGQMRNHVKIHDWNSLSSDFDVLNKHRERVAATTTTSTVVPKVISSLKASTSGAPEPAPVAPDVYIRALVMLENALEADLAAKGDLKLSKTNTKALNAMKQRLRKNNRQYTEAIEAFRASGKDAMESDSEEESGESSSSTSSSDDDGPPVKKAPTRNRFLQGSDSSSSSSDTDSDSESDSSSDSELSDKGRKTGGGGGSRWLLKGQEKSDKPSVGPGKARVRTAQAKAASESEEDDEGEAAPGAEDVEAGFQVVGRGAKASAPFIPAADMTEAVVAARLRETLAARGRRGTNRAEQIATIEFLVTAAKSPRQRAQVLLHLISAQFDFSPSKSMYMPSKLWRSTLNNVTALFELAITHHPSLSSTDQGDDTDILVVASAENAALMGATVPDPTETDGKEPETPADTPVRGDLASLVERLDDELHKALQNIDAYSSLYVARLRDEAPWMELSALAQSYFEVTLGDLPRAARVATRRILHLYYKRDQLVATVNDLYKKQAAEEAGTPIPPTETEAASAEDVADEANATVVSAAAKGLEAPVGGPETASGQLRTLAVIVYRYGDERAKSQTMLAQIYNHAVGNRFYAGRDLLLVSHLQETVVLLDIGLQVLFNRAMTQLGLCAFHLGHPYEAHACLQDMCFPSATGGGGPVRLKELLAQGVVTMRGVEKTPEEEKAELRRQVPYHMHLSLDFIETAHLVSAMLLEVPAMALHRVKGDGGRRRAVSKSFQYFLRNSMKSAFPGPPENTRDHVMAATRCLMKALLGKHMILIASRWLESLATAHETIRVKSAAWDDSGVLLYSTLNHAKHCLPNGDSGTVATLPHPLYLTRVRGPALCYLDREGAPGILAWHDPSIRTLIHMKVFVDEDADVCRSRRSGGVGLSAGSRWGRCGWQALCCHNT